MSRIGVQNSVPRWILIVSGIVALLELVVSFQILFMPGTVLETVDLGAKDVKYLVYMWAARQFALAFIFAFATFKRSVPMLTIAYIFFLVMMVGDLLIGIAQNNTGLIMGAFVMCILSSAILFMLTKKRNTGATLT